MKKKEFKKKLSLNKTKIAILDKHDQESIKGGIITTLKENTGLTECITVNTLC